MSINVKRVLFSGAIWSVGTRLALKAVGFVSTAIMARLLLPSDYGVVAMSMLAVGLIQSFFQFGVGTTLLRKSELTREDLDSGWTLRFIVGVVVGLLLLLASPFAAMYFEEPRIQPVLWIFAACVALSSLENIGLVLAEKSFNYGLLFRQQLVCKLMIFMSSVSLGLWLRDYRALVGGVVTGYLSGLVTSYLMHPYRPRWSTRRIGEMWATSKWLLLGGVAGYVLGKGDEILAGRLGTTAEYGQYNVGSELGQLPTSEIGAPLLKAFLPALSAMPPDPEAVNQLIVKAFAAINTLTLPIGLGLAALAVPVTALALGPSWHEVAQYMVGYAIFGVISVSAAPLGPYLFFHGHAKLQSMTVWMEFALFAIVSLMLHPQLGLLALVLGRIAGTTCRQLANLWVAQKNCNLSIRACLLALWRPALGSLLMALMVWQVAAYVAEQGGGALMQVLAGVAVGASFYSLWALATWRLVGRPPGLEDTVMHFIRYRTL